MSRLVDLTNQRFGRLVVERYAKHSRWECVCDCGNRKTVNGDVLRSGRSNSCGCLRIEKGAERGKASRKHGHAIPKKETSEYRAWSGARSRCTSTGHTNYANYGGRGIVMCERWLSSYENFLADMGPKPSLYHSLDRIDVNGNYEPSNCRWATENEQQSNRTDNRHILVDGEKNTLSNWCRHYGIRVETFYRRVRAGMTEQEALTTPHMRPGRKANH